MTLVKLTELFAQYKDEILLASLTLNLLLLLVLASRMPGKREDQDKVKRAMYYPKPFRKDKNG